MVDSAAIGPWHIGKLPDKRARKVLEDFKVEYSIENKARQINPEDFYKFDYIFGMDEDNISDLERIKPGGSKAAILLLGDFDPQGERIIRDPYYVINVYLTYKKYKITITILCRTTARPVSSAATSNACGAARSSFGKNTPAICKTVRFH